MEIWIMQGWGGFWPGSGAAGEHLAGRCHLLVPARLLIRPLAKCQSARGFRGVTGWPAGIAVPPARAR